jgi:hypothetical protein
MRGLQLLIAIGVFSTALVAADSPFLGTWKLNPAKSKATPGTALKEMTVKFEKDGEHIKRTATGVDSDGNPVSQMATMPWDGKEHKIDNPAGPTITVAVKPKNDHSLDVTIRADGKVVSSGGLVVSKDGKTMTGTAKGEDQKGRKIDNVEVYEKQ